jgi:hypothetical protein
VHSSSSRWPQRPPGRVATGASPRGAAATAPPPRRGSCLALGHPRPAISPGGATHVVEPTRWAGRGHERTRPAPPAMSALDEGARGVRTLTRQAAWPHVARPGRKRFLTASKHTVHYRCNGTDAHGAATCQIRPSATLLPASIPEEISDRIARTQRNSFLSSRESSNYPCAKG